MSSAAKKIVARAPRYVLRPQDNCVMRFAPVHKEGQTFTTQVIDISESGLSFLVSGFEPPAVGDLLRVEFAVPGKSHMTCFASVVRIQTLESKEPADHPTYTKIGLKFSNLPTPQRKALQLALAGKRIEMADETSHEFKGTVGQWAVFGFLALALAFSLFCMTFSPTSWFVSPIREAAAQSR